MLSPESDVLRPKRIIWGLRALRVQSKVSFWALRIFRPQTWNVGNHFLKVWSPPTPQIKNPENLGHGAFLRLRPQPKLKSWILCCATQTMDWRIWVLSPSYFVRTKMPIANASPKWQPPMQFPKASPQCQSQNPGPQYKSPQTFTHWCTIKRTQCKHNSMLVRAASPIHLTTPQKPKNFHTLMSCEKDIRLQMRIWTQCNTCEV